MDKRNPEQPCGIYLRGVVVSSTARLIYRKDGSGRSVLVTHEIGTKPGLAKWTRFLEETDATVKVEGDQVVSFPKLEELQPIHLKVNALRADKGVVEVKNAEILP